MKEKNSGRKLKLGKKNFNGKKKVGSFERK